MLTSTATRHDHRRSLTAVGGRAVRQRRIPISLPAVGLRIHSYLVENQSRGNQHRGLIANLTVTLHLRFASRRPCFAEFGPTNEAIGSGGACMFAQDSQGSGNTVETLN